MSWNYITKMSPVTTTLSTNSFKKFMIMIYFFKMHAMQTSHTIWALIFWQSCGWY